MKEQNRRMQGADYEQLAADYLSARGLEILERNFYSRYGEIDLIARDGAYLVFVEVKFRRDGRLGTAMEAVTPQKQRRIWNTARYYLYLHHYEPDTSCRFDVVGITGQEICWLPDAFFC